MQPVLFGQELAKRAMGLGSWLILIGFSALVPISLLASLNYPFIRLKFSEPLLCVVPHAEPGDKEAVPSILSSRSSLSRCCSCRNLDKNTAAYTRPPNYSNVLRSSCGFIFYFLSTPVSPYLADML